MFSHITNAFNDTPNAIAIRFKFIKLRVRRKVVQPKYSCVLQRFIVNGIRFKVLKACVGEMGLVRVYRAMKDAHWNEVAYIRFISRVTTIFIKAFLPVPINTQHHTCIQRGLQSTRNVIFTYCNVEREKKNSLQFIVGDGLATDSLFLSFNTYKIAKSC